MTRKLFGTDGVRGKANSDPMTAETALKLAMAAGHFFRRTGHHPSVVIGKDTRLSGYLLEPALTAGFIAMGMDVVLLGPIPTPAVPFLTRSLRADLGLMISASHNTYEDNGIKLFGPDGYKLSDDVELSIENLISTGVEDFRAQPEGIGRARRLSDTPGRYIEYVKSTFPRGMRLDSLKVVVDCAHGAAYRVAPPVLWELGAEVITIGNEPNGRNINLDCGVMSLEPLREAVCTHGADVGIALDGDADRVILCDEKGQTVDGDQILARLACDFQDSGILRKNGIVTTVMSNLALERFLTDKGIAVARTQVGDRYVSEHMRQKGYNLGGEQSGHIVFSDFTTTGDGLIAALQVLLAIVRSGQPASTVCRLFDPLPQILRSVRFQGQSPLAEPRLEKAIIQAEKRLSGQGRLVVRPSGTEPLIRVMAESEDADLLEDIVGSLCTAIKDTARLTA